MRFVIGVHYDDQPGEDMGAVALILAQELLEYDGITSVEVHDDTATIVSPPGAAILAGGDWTYPVDSEQEPNDPPSSGNTEKDSVT